MQKNWDNKLSDIFTLHQVSPLYSGYYETYVYPSGPFDPRIISQSIKDWANIHWKDLGHFETVGIDKIRCIPAILFRYSSMGKREREYFRCKGMDAYLSRFKPKRKSKYKTGDSQVRREWRNIRYQTIGTGRVFLPELDFFGMMYGSLDLSKGQSGQNIEGATGLTPTL